MRKLLEIIANWPVNRNSGPDEMAAITAMQALASTALERATTTYVKEQPVMNIATNEDRAYWAHIALEAFVTETGTEDCDAIADLIGDLCHCAEAAGKDPLKEVRRGLGMYADERDYPPDGWAPSNNMAYVTIKIKRGKKGSYHD